MPVVHVYHRGLGWERQSSTRIDSARSISGSGLEQPSGHISFVVSGRVVRSRCAVMTMCGFPSRTAWKSSVGVDTFTCSAGPRSLMTSPNPTTCTWCCWSGREGFEHLRTGSISGLTTCCASSVPAADPCKFTLLLPRRGYLVKADEIGGTKQCEFMRGPTGLSASFQASAVDIDAGTSAIGIAYEPEARNWTSK